MVTSRNLGDWGSSKSIVGVMKLKAPLFLFLPLPSLSFTLYLLSFLPLSILSYFLLHSFPFLLLLSSSSSFYASPAFLYPFLPSFFCPFLLPLFLFLLSSTFPSFLLPCIFSIKLTNITKCSLYICPLVFRVGGDTVFKSK